MNHKHTWIRTGSSRYTCPLQYEEKCPDCNKIRWMIDKGGIPKRNITKKELEQLKIKYPLAFNPKGI